MVELAMAGIDVVCSVVKYQVKLCRNREPTVFRVGCSIFLWFYFLGLLLLKVSTILLDLHYDSTSIFLFQLTVEN